VTVPVEIEINLGSTSETYFLYNPREDSMSLNLLLLSGSVAAALNTPAPVAQFYIVQEVGAARCTIVTEAPSARNQVIVADGANGRRSIAETEMKSLFTCNPQAEESEETDKPTQDGSGQDGHGQPSSR